MENCFIVDNRWSIESTVTAYCSKFKNHFLISNQCITSALRTVGTIDWMDTDTFVAYQRVRRFPPALAGESRLLYQSTHLFQGNWEELQEMFKTQISEIDNEREHA